MLKLNAGLESLIDNMSIEIFFTFLHQETFEVKVLTFKTWKGAPPWQLAVSELKTVGDSSKDIRHLLCFLTSKFDSYQAAKTASLNMMLPSGSPVEEQLSSRIRERCLGGEVTKPPTASLPPPSGALPPFAFIIPSLVLAVSRRE